LRFDMQDLAVMWFAAVLARLPTFVNLIYRTFRDWRDDPPDAVVLVDYPGLNFVLARRAHRLGIPVVYYIPPQLWAWAPWRTRKLARWFDRVLTVLPFEAEFLADAGVQAIHVGHPLGDHDWPEAAPEGNSVLLLPGSRQAELQAHLDLFLDVARGIAAVEPEVRFKVVVAKDGHRPLVQAAVDRSGLEVELVPISGTKEAFRTARMAVAKSGTTTLELGLAGVPQVIVYRVSRLARRVGPAHMTSPFIGLVNVAAGCEIAPEFLTASPDPAPIIASALSLYRDGAERDAALAGCRAVRERIGRPGAARRAADEVLALLDAAAPATPAES
jgi:lipid-A-disaccharide synthase